MSQNLLTRIPYTLLINILYLVSIFFILISIDNCIWFNYKLDKNIIYEKNELNDYNKEGTKKFMKIINQLLDNIDINGSLNFICIKTNIDIDYLYDLYESKHINDLKYKVENRIENKINNELENDNNINDVSKYKMKIDKYIKETKLNIDHCFYINKNLQNNLKNLLLHKLDETHKQKVNDIHKLNDNKYKEDLLQKINHYISVAKTNVVLFFERNQENFKKIDILITITNFIKTLFKLCVLFIGAKLILSIFSVKKWLSLIIIPFLIVTIYFVFYFIKDSVNLNIPNGVSIKGVGITNMLIGTILFYVSLLLNLLF
tara:strand:- start:374 stop:1324 length:951 start_codon:yes stop_codon:yes gene_type:complete